MEKIGFKQSRKSPDLYFEWRKDRSLLCVEEADKLLPLANKKVLDIGCGYGALSYWLLSRKARVWATEANGDKLAFAKKKLQPFPNFQSHLVKNEKLPFNDGFFDVVFIFDVIEHVKNPEKTLAECRRTLKKGGYLYVEFTPYYSITGHHLYDFAKWPIHILPEKWIKKIVFSKKVNSFMTPEYFWQQFKSLNKLRISAFQEMVKDYEKIKEKFIIKYPEVFEINIPFLNHLGPLKDYFTMSFEGLYRKE